MSQQTYPADTIASLSAAMAGSTLCKVPSHVPPHPVGSEEANKMSALASSSKTGVQPTAENDTVDEDQEVPSILQTDEHEVQTQAGGSGSLSPIKDDDLKDLVSELYLCTEISQEPGEEGDVGLGTITNRRLQANPLQEAFDEHVENWSKKLEIDYSSNEEGGQRDNVATEPSVLLTIATKALSKHKRAFSRSRLDCGPKASERNLAWRVRSVFGDKFKDQRINLVRRLPDRTIQPWSDEELNEEQELAVRYLTRPNSTQSGSAS